MKKLDLERAVLLLDVVSKGASHGQMYAGIANEARIELAEMNTQAQSNAGERDADAQKNISAAEQKELKAEPQINPLNEPAPIERKL